MTNFLGSIHSGSLAACYYEDCGILSFVSLSREDKGNFIFIRKSLVRKMDSFLSLLHFCTSRKDFQSGKLDLGAKHAQARVKSKAKSPFRCRGNFLSCLTRCRIVLSKVLRPLPMAYSRGEKCASFLPQTADADELTGARQEEEEEGKGILFLLQRASAREARGGNHVVSLCETELIREKIGWSRVYDRPLLLLLFGCKTSPKSGEVARKVNRLLWEKEEQRVDDVENLRLRKNYVAENVNFPPPTARKAILARLQCNHRLVHKVARILA